MRKWVHVLSLVPLVTLLYWSVPERLFFVWWRYKHFERWATANDFPLENVINDGSTTLDNRLGAVADLQLAIRSRWLQDDIMVVRRLRRPLSFFHHPSFCRHICHLNKLSIPQMPNLNWSDYIFIYMTVPGFIKGDILYHQCECD